MYTSCSLHIYKKLFQSHISSSCVLYLFIVKMHKIPFPSGGVTGLRHTPHSWAFQRQLNLIWFLGLFHWDFNCPLVGLAACKISKITGVQGHCMQILYPCMMLWIPWVISASWKCCYCWEKPCSLPCLMCSCNSFHTKRGESSCCHTGRDLCFPVTSPAMQVGPKQTLYRRVQSIAEDELRK